MGTSVTMHMVNLNNHVVVTFGQSLSVLQFNPAQAKEFGENLIKMANELLAAVPTKN